MMKRPKLPSIEETVRGLRQYRKGLKDVRSGLSQEVVALSLDPDGELMNRCEELISNVTRAIEDMGEDLAHERLTLIIAERKKDKWASPSCYDGWLCPDSPSGVCSYEDDIEDDCQHCGFPSERK